MTAEQIDMLKEGTTLVISADVFNGFMRLKVQDAPQSKST
jgi:hypothetical protein